jgi:hypothetical protein
MVGQYVLLGPTIVVDPVVGLMSCFEEKSL